MKPVTIKGLDNSLYILARAEALKEGKTIAQWLNEAIKDKLDKTKKKEG